MRVGISLASAHPGASDAEAPARMVERARAAAGAGLASLTVGDHHVTGPMPYVQNVPVLGRLLAEWDERPAGLLFLAPAWNPVLMAEQIGTLAALAQGPFIVQTGLGDRRTMRSLGVDAPHRGDRLEQVITTVQALLAGERMTDAALGLDDVAIAPRPPREVQWWIGATTPPALDRAARLGTGWYGNADLTPDAARAQMAIYLEACERHGQEPGVMAVRKDVFIADDHDEATAIGQALIDGGYRGMPREAVAFGDPAHVADELAVLAGIGFTDVIIRTMFVDQAAALRSIELSGEVARLLADR